MLAALNDQTTDRPNYIPARRWDAVNEMMRVQWIHNEQSAEHHFVLSGNNLIDRFSF